jgi:3-isopropylmalate dehydratase small subunit
MSGLTLTQKILGTHLRGARSLAPGSVIRVSVDWTLASELALNAMMSTFNRLGNPPLRDPARFYLAIDHTVDPVTVAHDARTQRLVQLSRDFAKRHAVSAFYDANETIMHTRFYRDHCLPGEVVVGADSHTSSHGAVGAFAIGLGGADVAVAALTGETWLEVPEAVAVYYRGEVPFGLTGKDIILRTLGMLGPNRSALGRTVEYRGEVTGSFSTDTRFTICNMTAELGGINGIFEPTAQTVSFLSQRRRTLSGARFLRADADAVYAESFHIDLGHLVPQVARPFSPDNVCGIDQVVGLPLDGCFIGACTTTEEELVLAGLVLDVMWRDGIRPRSSERRLVVPGDLDIRQRLADSGLLAVYERAGFRVAVPGCHLCLGVGSERAGEGEVWLSSQNRNYHNRMGKGSIAWLASAAAVAASSSPLELADPRPFLARVDRDRYAHILGRSTPTAPEIGEAQIVYEEVLAAPPVDALVEDEARSDGVVQGGTQRFGDHIDTDAIIPGEFCHLSDWKELGSHCCEYIRPGLAAASASGACIIVAGEAWGCGSARENAAWALIGAGIQIVLAKSFGAVHRRNLVNEGMPSLVIEDDEFFDLAGDGVQLHVDLQTQRVTHVASGRTFQGRGPTGVAASIVAAGGLIPSVKRAAGKAAATIPHGVSDRRQAEH